MKNSEELFAFDVAAERVLRGWEAAGQMVQTQDCFVKEFKATRENNDGQPLASGDFSLAGLLDDGYALTALR